MTKNNNSIDMTKGNVFRVLLSFALPIFVSNLFQQLYNVVDIAVIGHSLGDNALAAVGATTSLYSLIIGFVNGMCNGFCIVIARFFGADDKEKFNYSINHSALISVFISISATVLSLALIKPILRLLNTPADIINLSKSYISIIFLCCIITVAYNLLSSMLRAIGNSKVPLYALIIASLVNVALDILFVGYFKMNVQGAAIATVIAQLISVIFLAIYIKKKCPILCLKKECFRSQKEITKELFSTGLSMAFMLVLTSIGTVIMQGSINSFGTLTITGHTAARKFHDLCMLPFGTICTSAATFVSQNYGAGKKNRIKKGILSSIIIGTVWSAIVLLTTLAFGNFLIKTLTGSSNSSVLSVSMQYLYWNVPFYVLLNILLVTRNSLQALSSKMLPLIVSIVELIGKVACVVWLTPIAGYLGICLIEPITWVACLLVIIPAFIYKFKSLNKNNLEENLNE